MMSFNNGLPQLLADTGITSVVVYLMYKIIIRLMDKIPNPQ